MFYKKKILVLLLVLLLCFLIVIFSQPSYLLAIFLIMGIPAIINFYWLKNSRQRILLFSLVALILFAPPLELVSRLADAWDVNSAFSRPLGLIPWENMIFAFLNFFWGLCFYEYFIRQDKREKISPRFKWLILAYLIFGGLIFSVYFFAPQLVTWPYYYLGVGLLIALIILGWLQKGILVKTIWPTLFFTGVFGFFEVIALIHNYWWWPGEYLLPLYIGNQVFPLDDVIIWYFLSTPVLLLGYEYFMVGKVIDKQA